MTKKAQAPTGAPSETPPITRRCEIFGDVYDALIRLGVPAEVAGMVIAEVHPLWAGQQAYIPRDADDAERIRTERDAFIVTLQRAGLSYEAISRKVEKRYLKRLTRQRIGQIVSSADL